MGYFLGFAVLIAGYTLIDWGHYYVAHQPVSMWWLVSGKGNKGRVPRLGRQIMPGYKGAPGLQNPPTTGSFTA